MKQENWNLCSKVTFLLLHLSNFDFHEKKFCGQIFDIIINFFCKFHRNLLKKFEVFAYISNWAFFGCSQPCLCFLNMSISGRCVFKLSKISLQYWGNSSCWKKFLLKISMTFMKTITIRTSCCDYCFHWNLSSQLNFQSFLGYSTIVITNVAHWFVYTPMLIWLHPSFSCIFYLKIYNFAFYWIAIVYINPNQPGVFLN